MIMTAATAKTIQIYLPTGEPRGLRVAEITTRIVQAVLIPRNELATGKLRPEMSQPGIYFLFGEIEEQAKPVVYIGQTEDAPKRFDHHNKNKSFWQTAIYCVSKTHNFTQAHIRYLEWYAMQRAKEVGRYSLDNGQVPDNAPYVPEPMQAELMDVFETIGALLATLGFPVFEVVAKKDAASHIFYCRGGGSDGKGEMVDEGFVVYEGSRARLHIVASAEDSVGPNRQKLIDAGVMEERNGEYIFTEDYLFQSPSSAAAVVLGRSANGWVEWKDHAGLTLNDVFRNAGTDIEPTD